MISEPREKGPELVYGEAESCPSIPLTNSGKRRQGERGGREKYELARLNPLCAAKGAESLLGLIPFLSVRKALSTNLVRQSMARSQRTCVRGMSWCE